MITFCQGWSDLLNEWMTDRRDDHYNNSDDHKKDHDDVNGTYDDEDVNEHTDQGIRQCLWWDS